MSDIVTTLAPRQLKVKRLHEAAIIPKYQTPGAACFDLHAVLEGDDREFVHYTEPLAVRTGLSFEVPEGFVMMIYSRSGHGFKYSTRLANCVGVIDSDYRGEVMVKLTRDNDDEPQNLEIKHGDRIAQAMLIPVQQWEMVEVDELGETDRGAGGFGSTGKS